MCTGSPVSARRARPRATGSGSAGSGGCSASQANARSAYSAAGTRFRRSDLGSERISSVASSVRRPGTCQLNCAGIELIEQAHRHLDGHPVVGPAGVEHVVQGQLPTVHRPGDRKVGGIGLAVGHRQVGPAQREQVRIGPAGLLPPGVEVRGRGDAGRDPGLVEGQDRLVVDRQVAPPGPLLQSLDLGPQLGIGPEELVTGPPPALDQRGADEDRPGLVRVDRAVRHRPPGDDRHAVQADLLVRHHRARAGRPVRFGVLPGEQVLADLLDLLGGDRCDRPAPRAAWSR